MIIDCIADLHGHYPALEGGDLLIVAGDLTARDTKDNWNTFEMWLFDQNYKNKIIIGGNHDNFLQTMDEHRMWKYWDKVGITYLCDSGTEFEYEYFIDHPASNEHVSIDVLMSEKKKLKIWGSPWTLKFPGQNPHAMAFTCDTEEELVEKWAMIPEDTDILITHSPPIGVLDRTVDNRFVGSVSLSAQLGFLSNLKLHVFGHIHEAYGKIDPPACLPNYFDVCKHYSVNASHVNERYQPVNKPIRVRL
jgi:Icc-related predicted phosphoesterase